MRGFIVAMEYLGAGLGAGAGGRRVPVCEHAYNLGSTTLAGHPPPVRSPGGVSFLPARLEQPAAAITGLDDCP